MVSEGLHRMDGNATLAVKHLFPLINSPNATYVKRYLKRLQEAPWGCAEHSEVMELIEHILSVLGK